MDHSEPPSQFVAPKAPSKGPVKYVPTATAYDAWATVYDTDGNILQAIDDIELTTMLPEFLDLVLSSAPANDALRILDFGCGTGRNTAKLLRHAWPAGRVLDVIGVDASAGMLALARQKLAAYRPGLETEETSVNSSSIQGSSSAVAFVQHDFLASPDVPPTIPTPVSAMICTLVLEHFPLAPFFASFRNLLPVGGLALVTNMHSEMGLKGQAGFVSEQVDEQGRPVKIRGDSWPHTVEETVQAAEDAGFEIVALGGQGKIRERHVKEDMIEKLGDRAKKWVGVNVWYGFAVKRVQ